MFSTFLLMIVKISNKIMKKTEFNFYDPKYGESEKDSAITKDIIRALFPKWICAYTTMYDCYDCCMRGDKEYDGWCNCKVLIYLNKSILGLWSDNCGT